MQLREPANEASLHRRISIMAQDPRAAGMGSTKLGDSADSLCRFFRAFLRRGAAAR